jgi:hypothetical protein
MHRWRIGRHRRHIAPQAPAQIIQPNPCGGSPSAVGRWWQQVLPYALGGLGLGIAGGLGGWGWGVYPPAASAPVIPPLIAPTTPPVPIELPQPEAQPPSGPLAMPPQSAPPGQPPIIEATPPPPTIVTTEPSALATLAVASVSVVILYRRAMRAGA